MKTNRQTLSKDRWTLTIYHGSAPSVDFCSSLQISLVESKILSMGLLQLSHALTTVRHVNKTDDVTLGSTFGVCSYFHLKFLASTLLPDMIFYLLK